jgi:hypothetical protein
LRRRQGAGDAIAAGDACDDGSKES